MKMRLNGESGQAATEYILLLVLLVALIASLGRSILRPAILQLSEAMEAMVTRQFSQSLHRYRAR